MTATAPLIRLADVGKRYVRYEDKPTLIGLTGHLTPRRRRARTWALRHCNLEIRRGESIGVMGLNGAGKSTMLQILAGVTAPSEGRVDVAGRIAPLIQVGVGFHPELTGRDNILVNATVLGLGRREIESCFDEIVDFAELGDVIDTPVKFYSSGMYVRLGFSVAAAASPDVLLVDEVLAVGDAAFQLKSMARMERSLAAGTAMILVSHNVHLIRRLCRRSLVLHEGRVLFDGDTDDAISTFYHSVGRRIAVEEGKLTVSDEEAATVIVDVVDHRGVSTRHAETGEMVTVRLDGHLQRQITSPVLGLIVSNEAGVQVYREIFPDVLGAHREPGPLQVSFHVPVALAPGTYYVDAGLLEGGHDLAHVLAWSRPVVFHVSGRPFVEGAIDLRARVEIDRTEPMSHAAGVGAGLVDATERGR